MRKGKLGLTYNFYAVMAFVLLLFDQWVLCGLLCGMVMVVERDEWTTRQCLQAFLLTFVSLFAGMITGAIGSMGGGLLDLLGPLNPMAIIAGVIDFIFWILILIFTLIGVSRVAKGREANLPLVAKWANKAYGYMPQQQSYQQPPQNYQQPEPGAYPYPPAPQAPYAPPPAPGAPVYPPQPDMTVPPVYPPPPPPQQ